jgi:hypothetical protein
MKAAQADLTEPETVLGDPTVRSVIDMTQPTAIILAAVLHFLPARSAAAVCAKPTAIHRIRTCGLPPDGRTGGSRASYGHDRYF